MCIQYMRSEVNHCNGVMAPKAVFSLYDPHQHVAVPAKRLTKRERTQEPTCTKWYKPNSRLTDTLTIGARTCKSATHLLKEVPPTQ